MSGYAIGISNPGYVVEAYFYQGKFWDVNEFEFMFPEAAESSIRDELDNYPAHMLAERQPEVQALRYSEWVKLLGER